MSRERELLHFRILSPDDQLAAVRRLAASGMSPSTIAAATSLSVEQIVRLLEADNEAKGAA